MDEKENWLTVSEYALKYGKTRQGVYWMIKNKIIPADKVRLVKVKDIYQIKDIKE